jgi:LytS/YehU family sensor histidine kinase
MIERVAIFFIGAWIGSFIGDIFFNLLLYGSWHFAKGVLLSFAFSVAVTVGFYFGFMAAEEERANNDATPGQ